jgi:hypothetical protein
MSKSNEAFSDAVEQVNGISQDATAGERGGSGRRPSRMASTMEKYRAGKLLTLDEFVARLRTR